MYHKQHCLQQFVNIHPCLCDTLSRLYYRQEVFGKILVTLQSCFIGVFLILILYHCMHVYMYIHDIAHVIMPDKPFCFVLGTETACVEVELDSRLPVGGFLLTTTQRTQCLYMQGLKRQLTWLCVGTDITTHL